MCQYWLHLFEDDSVLISEDGAEDVAGDWGELPTESLPIDGDATSFPCDRFLRHTN